MTVRVRFAPSPTGYLHIGGARTALYDYLFAKAKGGQYILRIEDTDQERSTKEYETAMIEELRWLGIEHDVGPDKDDGLGPYRQSERLDIYMEHALKLVAEGKAFYDFCTDEELEAMRERAEQDGAAPYTGKWREQVNWEEAKQRVANGEKASIRFKVNPNNSYSFTDIVRKKVSFPAGMVGDFVIMRSNGVPTYNFCNVVDDHLHQISHVFRGDEHLNNTVRQLMIYEAFGWELPEFVHLSIMIGHDRQKLSKRHGATSVKLYREQGFLPDALNNYLCLLGWSHPDEKSIFKSQELFDVFDENRFNKSPAMYDIEKLKWTNSEHIKSMQSEEFISYIKESIPTEHFFNQQNEQWQIQCAALFQDKVQLATEVATLIDDLILSETVAKNETLNEILSWETTPQIAEYLKEQLISYQAEFVTAEIFGEWMNYCKKELKIKGKPLFMGFRGVLTGQDHGPDLKALIPLVRKEVLLSRISQIL